MQANPEQGPNDTVLRQIPLTELCKLIRIELLPKRSSALNRLDDKTSREYKNFTSKMNGAPEFIFKFFTLEDGIKLIEAYVPSAKNEAEIVIKPK